MFGSRAATPRGTTGGNVANGAGGNGGGGVVSNTAAAGGGAGDGSRGSGSTTPTPPSLIPLNGGGNAEAEAAVANNNTVTIVVKNVYRNTSIQLHVPVTAALGSLKEAIRENFEEKPAPSQQRLIYLGKVCTNDSIPLRDILLQSRQLDAKNPQTFHLVLGTGTSGAARSLAPPTTTTAPPARGGGGGITTASSSTSSAPIRPPAVVSPSPPTSSTPTTAAVERREGERGEEGASNTNSNNTSVQTIPSVNNNNNSNSSNNSLLGEGLRHRRRPSHGTATATNDDTTGTTPASLDTSLVPCSEEGQAPPQTPPSSHSGGVRGAGHTDSPPSWPSSPYHHHYPPGSEAAAVMHHHQQQYYQAAYAAHQWAVQQQYMMAAHHQHSPYGYGYMSPSHHPAMYSPYGYGHHHQGIHSPHMMPTPPHHHPHQQYVPGTPPYFHQPAQVFGGPVPPVDDPTGAAASAAPQSTTAIQVRRTIWHVLGDIGRSVWQLLDLTLAAKMIMLIFLLSPNDPQRLMGLIAVSVLAYLYQTGILGLFLGPAFGRPRNLMNEDNENDGFAAAAQNPPAPQAAADAGGEGVDAAAAADAGGAVEGVVAEGEGDAGGAAATTTNRLRHEPTEEATAAAAAVPVSWYQALKNKARLLCAGTLPIEPSYVLDITVLVASFFFSLFPTWQPVAAPRPTPPPQPVVENDEPAFPADPQFNQQQAAPIMAGGEGMGHVHQD